MKKFLITGGTGLVGTRLAELLEARGCDVHILTRREQAPQGRIKYFTWSVAGGSIQDGALDVDAVIHLAGAGVADKRWTAARKQEIRDSRLDSTRLLGQKLREAGTRVRSVVCASAVGYYGDGGDRILTEAGQPSSGFLPDLCREWEAESFAIGHGTGIPVAALRIGIVLSTKGGALAKLDLPARFGVSGLLGNGRQYMPWIHIDDLCRMFLFAAENQWEGAFNAAAPQPVTNREFMHAVARALHRPFIPVPSPPLALRLALGEMSGMLLQSQRTSAQKAMDAGFSFEFGDPQKALEDLYRRKV